VQRAAAAHAVYVPEPRHAVEVKAQEEHLARWLTRRIDVPVKLFDLRAQGFDLVGGRLLPDGSGKGAQLMYQDAQGLRVTVYLRKPELGTPAAFRYEKQGDLGLFYWVESGCRLRAGGRPAQGAAAGAGAGDLQPGRRQGRTLIFGLFPAGPQSRACFDLDRRHARLVPRPVSPAAAGGRCRAGPVRAGCRPAADGRCWSPGRCCAAASRSGCRPSLAGHGTTGPGARGRGGRHRGARGARARARVLGER
jgi:hypothetical protein